jgi:hypothetical protein
MTRGGSRLTRSQVNPDSDSMAEDRLVVCILGGALLPRRQGVLGIKRVKRIIVVL